MGELLSKDSKEMSIWQTRLLSSKEMSILRTGNFKTGKKSVRLYTIVSYRDRHLFAMDYENEHAYYLYVFKWFSVIIHDTMPKVRHTTRTMIGKVLGQRFEGILQQLRRSGL